MSGISRRLATIISLALTAISSAAPVSAEDLLAQFEKVRPVLERQLQSRVADERIRALEKLRKFPLAPAARLAHANFADPREPVRSMAYATLLAINGEQEVCDALFELAADGMRARGNPKLVPPALAALLSSNLPIAQINTRQFLDTTVAASPLGPEIALSIADTLAVRRQPEDVATLARLSQSKLFASHFGVRRAVVDALVKIPTKDAVGSLIAMMHRAGGEAKADAAEHLTKVTGQNFATNAAAWQGWWAKAGEAFEYPNLSQNSTYRSVITKSESGYYYGMPLFAERVVFVLDTSSSMGGGRLVAAKRELVKVIAGLPDHVHFGIVVFNSRVYGWQKKLVPANEKMKQAAISYVGGQNPNSSTASYDALETALAYDTEAIYFLSDGAPTMGKIVAPVLIINAVTAANKVRRISIYTIGIAPGFPGSPTDLFLKTLSEGNFGNYRRIDG
ncbi:MAG: VWA domain-containing protein [Pirellulales bacterium]